MRTALDLPVDGLDDRERVFVAAIREHGWFGVHVPADEDGPGFAYTTGFWVNSGQPELILFSINNDVAQAVFWELFREAKQGVAVKLGRRIGTVFGGLPAYAFRVAERHQADFLGWSRWFYRGAAFPCVQVVWPDRAGLFPWEAGFDEAFRGDQPDLSESGWANEVVDR